jgi:hypothetical protein
MVFICVVPVIRREANREDEEPTLLIYCFSTFFHTQWNAGYEYKKVHK